MKSFSSRTKWFGAVASSLSNGTKRTLKGCFLVLNPRMIGELVVYVQA